VARAVEKVSINGRAMSRLIGCIHFAEGAIHCRPDFTAASGKFTQTLG
jgi:hypothetical protein